MIYSITVYQTREMLCQVCDRVISERERLTLLDGPIGRISLGGPAGGIVCYGRYGADRLVRRTYVYR